MTQNLLECAVRSLDKHLARDITAIDVEAVSPIADHFVFASGGSTTQVKALCDYVEEDMAKAGFSPLRVEGYAAANWILMDFGALVVHIFTKDARLFYDLEHLWQDGTTVDITDYMETEGI